MVALGNAQGFNVSGSGGTSEDRWNFAMQRMKQGEEAAARAAQAKAAGKQAGQGAQGAGNDGQQGAGQADGAGGPQGMQQAGSDQFNRGQTPDEAQQLRTRQQLGMKGDDKGKSDPDGDDGRRDPVERQRVRQTMQRLHLEEGVLGRMEREASRLQGVQMS